MLDIFVLAAGIAAAPRPAAVEFTFAGAQCFHHQAELAAGARLEICGPLPKGEVVLWKFQAGSDIGVAIGMEGARDVASHSASRGSGGQFVAPGEARYCWRFVNPGGATAALSMELEHP